VILWSEQTADIDTDTIQNLANATSHRPLELVVPAAKAKRESFGDIDLTMVCVDSKLFTAMNQLAAAASGSYLCFLNSCILPENADWADAMMRQAQRPQVGAVGSYIQNQKGIGRHAGYAIGRKQIAASYCQGPLLRNTRQMMRHGIARDVAAVSFAYCMMRTEVFHRCGCFCEAYSAYLSDIDLCQQILKIGLCNLYLPNAPARYQERRGAASPFWDGGIAVGERDASIYRQRHPEGAVDPYYNIQFSLSDAKYRDYNYNVSILCERGKTK